MILDKNGKLFGKINIIDVAVILVAIAVVIGVFVRFTGGAGKIVKETKKIEYVVQISGVRGYTVDALEKKRTCDGQEICGSGRRDYKCGKRAGDT